MAGQSHLNNAFLQEILSMREAHVERHYLYYIKSKITRMAMKNTQASWNHFAEQKKDSRSARICAYCNELVCRILYKSDTTRVARANELI